MKSPAAANDEAMHLSRPLPDDEELVDHVPFHFEVGRRTFLQLLGSGLLIAVSTSEKSNAQERGGRRGGGQAIPVAGRLHIGKDGAITVFTGKVECGQGSRAELTQAAAEELRVAPDRITLLMADTDTVPNDGGTAGSRTTPSTVPAVRAGCAAARDLLIAAAAKTWGSDPAGIVIANGSATSSDGSRHYAYADLAADEAAAQTLGDTVPDDVTLTVIPEWKTLGKPLARPNGRDIVTGTHAYPSDITRPGMLYGHVLRPPAYTAKLVSIDLAAAEAMEGVTVVRDGEFVAVAAPTSWLAREAGAALAKSVRWETSPHPASNTLSEHLRTTAHDLPENPHAEETAAAKTTVRETYTIAYVQHAPMEPRAAVAEWGADGKLTVWTGTQMPFRVRSELARAFKVSENSVRVIVPDFGGGFGGKHSGECAVEAARIAKAAGKPVKLRWTREEEFTWAYFRPAAVIEAEASLDVDGKLTSWHFVNINAGGNGIDSPYHCGKKHTRSVGADAPLRHGSYRSLAVTGNTFARECLMDELALAAGTDPLAFRLAHLESGRLRDVLVEAAEKFGFADRWKNKAPSVGVGIACGLDKGSYVAACAEISVSENSIKVNHVCQAYECGKILNPHNLVAQVEGAILMGLGPVLREEMTFEGGRITNAAFSRYAVPRFADVPTLDIHLLDRPDLPSVGAGETPLIVVAPAVGNAVFHMTGRRLRDMPLRLG
ncbi:MAG: molybdopterin cofactor-binding domain-containing protein [Verrucomicrobiales bacterium]